MGDATFKRLAAHGDAGECVQPGVLDRPPERPVGDAAEDFHGVVPACVVVGRRVTGEEDPAVGIRVGAHPAAERAGQQDARMQFQRHQPAVGVRRHGLGDELHDVVAGVQIDLVGILVGPLAAHLDQFGLERAAAGEHREVERPAELAPSAERETDVETVFSRVLDREGGGVLDAVLAALHLAAEVAADFQLGDLRPVGDDHLADDELGDVEVFLQQRGRERLEVTDVVESEGGVVRRQHVAQPGAGDGGIARKRAFRAEFHAEQVGDGKFILHPVQPPDSDAAGIRLVAVHAELGFLDPAGDGQALFIARLVFAGRRHQLVADDFPRLLPMVAVLAGLVRLEDLVEGEAAAAEAVAVAVIAVALEQHLGARRRVGGGSAGHGRENGGHGGGEAAAASGRSWGGWRSHRLGFRDGGFRWPPH